MKKRSGETKPLTGVQKVMPAEANKTVVANNHEITLTHLSKIFWPEEGFTKGDVIDYYDKISDHILPWLHNRPLSLRRNPNGIADEGFFQKDAGGQAPDWVQKTEIFSESTHKTIHYIICNNKASLLYIANLGCIELNPWNSALPDLDKPNYMIIDIDPSPKNTFDEVVETAQTVKTVLDIAGASGYCKTSGATGLHIYIPLGGKYDYGQARDFGHLIAAITVKQLPGLASIKRNLAKRGDKIYMDYLQNSKGQTLACAYSLRPRPGAQVSAPLEWGEVKKGLHPSQFTIANMAGRLEKKGDLFAPVLQKGIDLEKCLERLSSL